ncbi:MAG: hypothetical protein ACLVIV_12505 [Acutalibacteraceae bacterium]
MKATEHLSALLHAQKQTLWELEAEIASLSAKDFLTENDRLKAELAHTANRCRQAEQTRDTLKKELEAVQEALHTKLYSEKQLALRLASKRLSAYYQAQDAAEENRLVAFEKTIRKRIELLQRQAKEEDEALFSELSAEFDRLRALSRADRACAASGRQTPPPCRRGRPRPSAHCKTNRSPGRRPAPPCAAAVLKR